MKLTFWGVRGSICAPGKQTARYGGNTSCVELRSDAGKLYIIDGGTGIRQLGLSLAKHAPISASIFITHMHWDHIEGLPFFVPLYSPKNKFNFIGCPSSGSCDVTGVSSFLKTVLEHALARPYFPIGLSDLKAEMTFKDLCGGSIRIDDLRVDVLGINHPDKAVAYKFTDNGKVFVHMTDNELFNDNLTVTPYQEIVNFCRNADVLVHDAMYTNEEWRIRQGWGHSTYDNAVKLALDARVKKLALFHHDPAHTDAAIDAIIKHCRATIKKSKSKMHCQAAAEGQTLSI